MKKKLVVILLVLFTLAVFTPPPVEAMSPCESFAANARVNSYSSYWDAFRCAASDFGTFLDLIT